MDFDLGGAYKSFTKILDTFGTQNFPGRGTIESVVSKGVTAEGLLAQGADYALGKMGVNHSFGFGRHRPGPVGPKDPRGSLSRAQARPDPLMSWRWEAIVPGIKSEFIEDIVVPLPTFDVEPTWQNGSKIYLAKFNDVAAFQLNLYVDTENTAINWLFDWFSTIRNSDSTYNYPIEYKKDIHVHLLDPVGHIACRFVLKDCFPSTGSGYNLQSASSDRIVLAVEISLDNIIMVNSQRSDVAQLTTSLPLSVPKMENISGFAAPLLQGADTLIDTFSGKAMSYLPKNPFSGF